MIATVFQPHKHIMLTRSRFSLKIGIMKSGKSLRNFAFLLVRRQKPCKGVDVFRFQRHCTFKSLLIFILDVDHYKSLIIDHNWFY